MLPPEKLTLPTGVSLCAQAAIGKAIAAAVTAARIDCFMSELLILNALGEIPGIGDLSARLTGSGACHAADIATEPIRGAGTALLTAVTLATGIVPPEDTSAGVYATIGYSRSCIACTVCIRKQR